MTYPETIEFLYGIRLFGQKLGLDTMRELLRRMGNPQDVLRFIHIAGTNGKGSVAAMCHAVLTAAGHRSGLYTSPHLVSFCERFRIADELIAEADVVRLVAQIRPLLDEVAAVPGLRTPTFFEIVTAVALQYFRERNVDIVVWETGLGGRLDATNVVTPLVSVITNIAFDHMQYLGETLEQITLEKCGIIKPGVPVVTSARREDALELIRRMCRERGCALTEVTQPVDYESPLAGEHQRWNCATALATLKATGLKISEAQLRDGLRRTEWPGRFQIVEGKPPVVLDGAHNAAAAEDLAAAVRHKFQGSRVTVILGVLRDKDYAAICTILAPLAARVFCVPVNSDRTSDPADLAQLCRQANPSAGVTATAGLPAAYAEAIRRDDPVVITGSLFLVGEALAKLGLPHVRPAVCDKELVLQ